MGEIYRLDDVEKEVFAQRFFNNMQAMQKYFPDIYKRFCNYTPKDEYVFVHTLDYDDVNLYQEKSISCTGGLLYNISPSLYCKKQVSAFLQKDKAFYAFAKEKDKYGQFHSHYLNELIDNVKELQTHFDVDNKKVKSLPFVMLYGVGIGYILQDLYSNIEVLNLVLVENNLDLFYASLYAFDWAPLLDFINDNNYGLKIIFDENNDVDLNYELNCYFERNGKFLARAYVPLVNTIDTHLISKKEQMDDDILRMQLSLGFIDDRLFAISHALKSLLSNVYLFNKKRQKALEDVPLFVIASGPSLDKDIDFLSKNQDKAIIIACGTALEILYNKGILPDFFVTTERTYELSLILSFLDKKNFLDKITLISSEVVHPKVLSYFKQSILFSKGDESIFYLLMQDDKYFDFIKAWGSLHLINPLVANCGLSTALALHFKDIYLFGVDNGVALHQDEDSVHSQNSLIYDEDLKNKDGSKVNAIDGLDERVIGNFSHVILTNTLYRQSADNMQRLIAYYKNNVFDNFRVINCSDGLKIGHTLSKKTSDLTFDKSLYKKTIVDEICNNTLSLNLTKDEIERLLNIDKYQNLIDKICNRFDVDFDNRSKAYLLMQDIAMYLNNLRQTRECFYASIIEGSVLTFFVEAQYVLFCIYDETKALKLTRKVFKYLSYLLKDSIKLFALLPHYIQHDHLKLIDNKIGFEHEDFEVLKDFKEYNIFTKEVLDSLKDKFKDFKKIL